MTDNSATSPEPATVRLERVLPAPIERVWQYLMEPSLRATWLADGPIEPRVGGRVALLFDHRRLSAEETPARYRDMDMRSLGEVRRCEPPRLLVITWNDQGGEPSEVTFDLEPRGERTRLLITHRRLATADALCSVAGGWHVHVDILEDVLAARPPRLFWARHEQFERAYRQQFFGDATPATDPLAS